MQPLDMLNQLKNIHDGQEKPTTGATPSESDDS
jgi:hypothetical protein